MGNWLLSFIPGFLPSCLSVGVSMKTSSLNKFPGSENNSFGYQSDGCVYHGSPTLSTKFGPRFNENDIIGCGVDFLSQSLFFTRNGIFLGKAFEGKVPVGAGTRLFPTIGLQGRGIRVTTNFGQHPFYFAFENHLKTERISRENKLIERTCKEDFAGIKIKELVSGYLVHHGYVATAKAFSHWSNLASSVQNSEFQKDQIQIFNEKISSRSNLVSSSSETNVDVNSDVTYKESNPSVLQRRHSDSSCLAPEITNSHLGQLPGIASMLHRRRLRALCRRCQYGRAAATLNRFYPQVLERCPELLVQLRCRQLIEMMRRHAVRRGRSHASNSGSDLNDSNSTTAPPKVQRVSGSLHVGSGCCVINKPDKLSQDTSSSVQMIVENGLPPLSMDVDPENVLKAPFLENAVKVVGQKTKVDQDCNLFTELDDDLETADVEDEEDDDGFGVDDDTGVCIDTLLPHTNSKVKLSSNGSCVPSGMDADNGMSSAGSTSKPTADVSFTLSTNSELDNDDEMRCLLRHVQFGRSLVNLVRQVRAKTGGLSLETERLLQQSVSLLAYPSPTSNDCPLRGLLDPVWRDTIASVINSAVLKAHDLPAQPALEHGLRALQRCFQDKNFVEAQTLGHFLLYHLTPAQIAKADEEVAALEASIEHQSGKRLRSSPSQSNGDQINDPDDNTSGSHGNEINGHNAIRRRARRRRRRRVGGTVSESQSSEHTDECNSSVEEVNKEDDEEEEEDEEGRCNSEDDDDDFDNDDDEEDGSSAVPSRRPNTRSRQTASVGAQSDSGFSESRGSNGGSSGRSHSIYSSNTASLTPTGTVAPNIRLGRQTDLARYLPSFLYSNHTRLITSVSSSSVPTLHRSSATSRRFTTLTTSAPIDSNHSRRCETVDSHFDSAFRGLLSMSYPHRAEFLAAMDDALKAYAGSLLLTEDEQIVASNPQHEYLQRDSPSPTGGGSCT
ncbi:unnamed protein product [Schistosoma spindalis]|nr:unnamed protein product [Schistosoma spindale]